jgi:hypothetical protein
MVELLNSTGANIYNFILFSLAFHFNVFNCFIVVDTHMFPYYFYNNGSHLYVIPKPLTERPSINDTLQDYVSERFIHWYNVKPTFINCTLAPLAEDCLPHNLTNLQQILQFIQEYYRLMISIAILALVFLLVLTNLYIIRQNRQRQTIEKSKDNDSYCGHYHNPVYELQETIPLGGTAFNYRQPSITTFKMKDRNGKNKVRFEFID